MSKEKQIIEDMACENCLHHFACLTNSEYVPTPCPAYEDKAGYRKQKEDTVEVVRCKDCKFSRPLDKSKSPEKYFKNSCVVCECETVVGDEPMIYTNTHFCSYGAKMKGGAE